MSAGLLKAPVARTPHHRTAAAPPGRPRQGQRHAVPDAGLRPSAGHVDGARRDRRDRSADAVEAGPRPRSHSAAERVRRPPRHDRARAAVRDGRRHAVDQEPAARGVAQPEAAGQARAGAAADRQRRGPAPLDLPAPRPRAQRRSLARRRLDRRRDAGRAVELPLDVLRVPRHRAAVERLDADARRARDRGDALCGCARRRRLRARRRVAAAARRSGRLAQALQARAGVDRSPGPGRQRGRCSRERHEAAAAALQPVARRRERLGVRETPHRTRASAPSASNRATAALRRA